MTQGVGTQGIPCQIFVYGTLKPGERAFSRFCEPYVVDKQAAITPGRIYDLPFGYPALTLEEGWVQGVLLTVSSPTVLVKLDEFEAFYPDHPQDSEYQRIWHRIYAADQTLLTHAWVYAMTKEQVDTLGGTWLPAGIWSSR